MQRSTKLLAAIASAGMVLGSTATANAAPPAGDDSSRPQRSDSLDSPRGRAQAEARARAFEQVVAGKAKPTGRNKVVQTAKGQYVELAREGEDRIWTVLAEFGDGVDPAHPGAAGPLRNAIPQPDRGVDNSTIWTPDFNADHYRRMFFADAPGANSVRAYYREQSSNRYAVNGDVTDWVRVPFNASRYGANVNGSDAHPWDFINDSVDAWAAGKSTAEIDAALAPYDVWDRYDVDGDGDFQEPDGYIDHFQAVHAGEGEEVGGGAQGDDAIWSHRWYAHYAGNGPDGAGAHGLGGVRIGSSNFWIGDYTVEPENGGVGVFAHEFAHDLGVPDLYDTSANVGGSDNSTGYWTIMSSGSYGSTGAPADGIGSKPVGMGAYEKLLLGWSNVTVVGAGERASIKLGPANANTKQAQQVLVQLPPKQVRTDIGAPYAGAAFYHSGSGNDLDRSMTRTVTLPAGTATFAAKARYDIETDWDYAYLTVNGTPVATNRSTSSDPFGQNRGHGITGSTGDSWVDLTADLSAYAGQTVTIGLRYWTDGAVAGAGFGLDDIAISGQAVDGAETPAGWTFNGFFTTSGSISKSFFNAYFAEYRTYRGYDEALRTGPHNWGFPTPALVNWAEHYPYQDGMLVWYYDTSFDDNNVGDACAAGRCGGLVLPVDAHPDLLMRPGGTRVWNPRMQSHDSTFGLEPTDRFTVHVAGVPATIGGLPAVPLFDDTRSYWVAPNPSIGHFGWTSVPLPATGTKIRVNSVSAQDSFMQITVNP